MVNYQSCFDGEFQIALLTMQEFEGFLMEFDNLKLTISDEKSSSPVTYSKDDFMKIKENVTVKKTWKPMLELCNRRFIEKLLFEEDEIYASKYECFREGYGPNRNAEALIEAANRRAIQPMPQRYVRPPPPMPLSNQGQFAMFMNRADCFHRPLSPGMDSGYNSRWENTQSFNNGHYLMHGKQKGKQTFTDGYDDNHDVQFRFDEVPFSGDGKGSQFYDPERLSGKGQMQRAYYGNRFALNSEMRQAPNYGGPPGMEYQRRLFAQSYERLYAPPFIRRRYNFTAFAVPEEERMLCCALIPFDYKTVTDAVLQYNYVDIHPKLMDLIKNYYTMKSGKSPDTLKVRKYENTRVEIEADFKRENIQLCAEAVLKDVQVLESLSASFKQAKPTAKTFKVKRKKRVHGDDIYLKIENANAMNGYYSPSEILMLIKVGIVEMTSQLKLPGSTEFQTLRDVLRAHGTLPGLKEQLDLQSIYNAQMKIELIIMSECFLSVKLISMHVSGRMIFVYVLSFGCAVELRHAVDVVCIF
ncbi:hypothetical protein T4A_9526 [Trichinella pseudospiralis]|uniref:Uncharacterized protein n=2 Tax=Trichinella pseudospiralis TaxID=6337 RepID=A0A0V1IQW1_TRIPS|nr:hypothetical protein T4A_9526 [Trichinella pseudospiralis]KRZ24998.1 hypothetical protein T4C_10619 [Trichinella pseudospiralis]